MRLVISRHREKAGGLEGIEPGRGEAEGEEVGDAGRGQLLWVWCGFFSKCSEQRKRAPGWSSALATPYPLY